MTVRTMQAYRTDRFQNSLSKEEEMFAMIMQAMKMMILYLTTLEEEVFTQNERQNHRILQTGESVIG